MKEIDRRVTAFEARTHLGELLDYVRYTKQPCFIERHGRSIAVLIDIDSFERLKLPQRYQQHIQRAVKQIVEGYHPQKVILFGSAARGEAREGSDIDLLIIKETSERRLDRIARIFHYVDPDSFIEPHVFTPDELAQRLAVGDSFLETALREGHVVYEAAT